MSACGYYSCCKGKPTCNHPAKGEYKTKCFRRGGGGSWHPCELCKQSCGGIYPSQLTRLDLAGYEVEIVDKGGHVIVGGL